MSVKSRLYALAATVVATVMLNLALVVPVFADNDGYDGDEGSGWFLPVVLIALLAAAVIGGAIYWRSRRSETPQG
jgi:hypothetical protein